MRRTLLPTAVVLIALTSCAADDGGELRNDLAAATAGEAAPQVPDTGEGEGPEEEEQPDTGTLEPVEVPTDVVDAEGDVVGAAYLRDGQQGAEVDVEVRGLAPGFHPMGLYGVGACDVGGDPAGPFSSVGDLLTPLPPVLVLENGVGSLSALVDSAPAVEGLLVGDGTALVLGEAVADPAAAPVGQGPPVASRVACAAFTG